MTQRDGTGREVGEGFRIGNTCIPMADSCWYMAEPIQYCKVKLKKKKFREIIIIAHIQIIFMPVARAKQKDH